MPAKIYAENPPESITIPLKHRIHFGETIIEELTVRPMCSGDQARMKTPTDRPMALITELSAYLTGQPSQVIAVVTGDDLAKLNTAVQLFFTRSQEIGNEPSQS